MAYKYRNTSLFAAPLLLCMTSLGFAQSAEEKKLETEKKSENVEETEDVVQETEKNDGWDEAQTDKFKEHQKLTPDEIVMLDDAITNTQAVLLGFGFTVGVIPHVSLAYNYRVSRSLWIEGSGHFGSYSLNEDDLETDQQSDNVTSTATVNSSVLHAGARFFITDSLNIRGGLGLRSIAYEITLEEANTNNSLDLEGSVTSLGGYFSVGNTWSLGRDRVQFGCDWIGVFLPLTNSSSSSETTASGTASSELDSAASDNKDLAEKLGKSYNISLFNVHVGISF